MTRTTLTRLIGMIGILGIAVSPTLARTAGGPDPVSPGHPHRWAPIEGRCPGFSWTWSPEATTVELAVFTLPPAAADPDAFDPVDAELVLLERLPGATSSWTPSLDRCLEPGRRYAWYVRALVETPGDPAPQVTAVSEWSRARLFEVAARPSPGEVEAAIEVLLRHRAEAGGAAHIERGVDRAVETERLPVEREAKPVAERPGKVRERKPTTTGPRLRVEGVISGDGSELTSVDAETLDGLDSTAFLYSGATPITVSGTAISLSTSGCSSNELWVWNGSLWSCQALTGASLFQNNSIVAGHLATDSVGASEIAENAVGPLEIASGAVRRSELSGTEVSLYRVPSYCGGNASSLTLSEECFTTICNPGPPAILFYNCNGSCLSSNTNPQQCANTRVGYLLYPFMLE